MEKIYEKLKEMPEAKFISLQKILGLAAGILCWLSLRAGNFSEQDVVTFLFLAIFIAIIFGVRTVSRKIERPLNKFQTFMAIGLAVCLVIFALFTFVLSPYVFGYEHNRGLIEIIFNIPV